MDIRSGNIGSGAVTVTRAPGLSGTCAIADPSCGCPPQTVFSHSCVFSLYMVPLQRTTNTFQSSYYALRFGHFTTLASWQLRSCAYAAAVFPTRDKTSISKVQYRKTVSRSVKSGAGQCSFLQQGCILRGGGIKKVGCPYSKGLEIPDPEGSEYG